MIEARTIQWTDEVVGKFWAYWSRRPQTYFTEAVGDALVRRFLPLLPRGGLVVDYGCGSGGLVQALLGADRRVVALDFSTETVNKAKERFKDRSGFLGAIQIGEIDTLAEGTVDAVFLVEAIEHMDDAHLDQCLANISRLLKPGGAVIVTTPNEEDIAAAEIYCPCCDTVFHPMQHQRSWSAASLGECLAQAGLRPTRLFATDFGADSLAQPMPYLIRLIKKALRRIDRDPHLCAVAIKS